MSSVSLAFSNTCRYCGSHNISQDHRCGRCGRRIALEAARPERRTVEAVPLPASPAEPGVRPAKQAALFRDGLRIVPIAPQTPKAPKAPRTTSRRAAPAADSQQYLAFGPVVTHNISPAEVRSEIHPNGRVAATTHRAVAAFVDAGIVAAAYGIMVAIFAIWGKGQLSADPFTLAIAAIMGVAVVALYQLFWVLADGDTPGLQLARLRLVDFDGRPATRKARLFRVASSWLSAAPAGLGLLWALLDEEALTWHDQISKTFPTPVYVSRNEI